MSGRIGLLGTALALAGVILIGAGMVAGGGPGPVATYPVIGAGMMRGGAAGMMGGGGMPYWSGTTGSTTPGPGDPGFVAGTADKPRVIRVIAGPGYTFTPSAITVAKGETVTFAITSMGGLVHEFMVGPAADVAADRAGTPEAGDLGMMQTGTVTYTFDGPGPYAFACHAPGHYEAGMQGTITVVG